MLTLSAVYMAYIARLTRAGMLEVLRSNYIRTARAKGLSERAVLMRHALRGGLLPVVSFSGPALAFLLTGTVVVERIFALPGLGNYFINANLNRDEPLIIGIVAFTSIADADLQSPRGRRLRASSIRGSGTEPWQPDAAALSTSRSTRAGRRHVAVEGCLAAAAPQPPGGLRHGASSA